MFPDQYSVFGEMFISGVLAYVAIVFIIRVSGKRSLSKLNSFDFIITISLGSILSGIIIDDSLTLAEGLFAFILLLVLQYIVTFISVRSDAFTNIIKFQPALLYYDGQFNYKTMKKERITKKEVLEAARHENYSSFDQVYAVILESEGTLSVVERGNNDTTDNISSLHNVETTAN